ncbi:DUF2789 domain-containing protein [Zhongshania sp.]|jgi:hypothetical protein|uniref:DUF2789 domain-containing protein n=1 Tax=Zhongshania sp. TaxID=1971902 RepID=UPI0039E5D556
MDTDLHTMNLLFDQLGLPSEDKEVERFIVRHRPLPRDLLIHEASFWKPAQASFLKESLDIDAEWAELVDELDARLRY